MLVHKVVQYVGPGGRILPTFPEVEPRTDWYRELRIRVTIEDKVYAYNHRDPMLDPKVDNPEYHEYLESQVVRGITDLIADEIKEQLHD